MIDYRLLLPSREISLTRSVHVQRTTYRDQTYGKGFMIHGQFRGIKVNINLRSETNLHVSCNIKELVPSIAVPLSDKALPRAYKKRTGS